MADLTVGRLRSDLRLSDQGSRCTVRLLRLPRRALEASANNEPHRKHLCDRAAPNSAGKGLPVEQDRARHDLQAR